MSFDITKEVGEFHKDECLFVCSGDYNVAKMVRVVALPTDQLGCSIVFGMGPITMDCTSSKYTRVLTCISFNNCGGCCCHPPRLEPLNSHHIIMIVNFNIDYNNNMFQGH